MRDFVKLLYVQKNIIFVAVQINNCTPALQSYNLSTIDGIHQIHEMVCIATVLGARI